MNGFHKICTRLAATVSLATCIFLMAVNVVHAESDSRPIDNILGVTLGADIEDVRLALNGKGERGGRDTRSGGYKEAWKLAHSADSQYSYIAYKTDRQNRIKWISGFLPPGESIAFSQLGDLATAVRNNSNVAIWNVITDAGGYKLVAKGQNGKASVVYLLSLSAG